ncbi:DUF4328 domain-containing protein [Dyella silvatica]|uniref:DUF4328 domain-containing protein n=1 Tax=Dyella silvatica TaxID=2992128 RepID=UPI00224D96E3|nr:DUF4328 domain-containing protein [Dyella silvatica]
MSEQNPYSAPVSALSGDGVLERERSYRYQPLDSLNRPLRGLLIATIAMLGITMLTLAYQWWTLQRLVDHQYASDSIMRSTAHFSDRLFASASGFLALIHTAAYIFGGMWIYRAACNVRALGAQGLDDSPGWAVGWYFIPFAGLVMPFRAMRQIWAGSLAPRQWRKLPTPGLLRWWWGLWLGINLFGMVVGFFVARAKLHSSDIPGLIQGVQLSMLNYLLSIGACALFLTVVTRMAQMQAKQHLAMTPPALPVSKWPEPSIA